jgi:hypothetical protein
MEPRMFQLLVRELAQALGVEDWGSEPKDIVRAKLGEHVTLIIDGSGETLLLRAQLGVLVTAEDGGALEAMLTGNLLGQQTGGACLGLEGQEAVLWKRLASRIGSKEVLLELEDFSNYAEVWVKLIEEAKAQP